MFWLPKITPSLPAVRTAAMGDATKLVMNTTKIKTIKIIRVI